jgi:hypothetical protein
VPVDTYLKRKNLSRYETLELQDVRVHVATTLSRWAESVVVDAERVLLFWKRFDVQVAHRHQPT